jgi:phospholipid/cholesterol/gamma-HCH transport system permease protein
MTGGATRALEQVGAFSLLIARSAREAVRRRPEGSVVLDQLYHLGVLSVGIATITALFTGMVLAIQTSYSLAAYGAKFFVGDIVALSIVRELGPVLSALMIAGRVGAGITAEIGTMKVTEELDALETMALNPIGFLVTPKLLAMLVMMPCLTTWADLMGIVGGSVFGVIGADYSF